MFRKPLLVLLLASSLAAHGETNAPLTQPPAKATDPTPNQTPGQRQAPKATAQVIAFGSVEILDVATVALKTYSPKTILLARTTSPSSILLISSNKSEQEIRNQLASLSAGPCIGGESSIPTDYALATSKVLAIYSNWQLRAARDEKRVTVHDAELNSQILVKANAVLLAHHFPTYRCQL